MSNLDLIIIVLYLFITVLIRFWVHKKIDKDDFLLNAKETSLKFMICTTVSSWIGAGAIVGVCSATFKSGISYGISVAVIIATFFAVFAFFSAKIKEFGDANKAYTIGDFFLLNMVKLHKKYIHFSHS